ncbi:MAG TPA: uroporphyrinogen-III synthase [Oxalicibacterium sp.]
MPELPSVVVTRPAAQADALAQRIAAIGRTPVLFPLLDILPLPDTVPLRAALADLDRYALIAFVSPNAIDAAFAARPDWPHGLQLAVVGDGSRAALERHGITPGNSTVFIPHDRERTDSQTLLEALDLPALRGKDILIVRGETGRELLGDALRAAGARVTPVAAYRRVMPAFTEQRRRELKRLLDGQNDWIVTSSEALRFLAQMVAQLDEKNKGKAVAKMQQQRVIASHVRIAETAESLGFRDVVRSASGDDGLLAALQSLS